MSGGGSPEDKSVELAQQQHQYEVDAAAQKAADDAAALTKWQGQNTAAQEAAKNEAVNYFVDQGLDPNEYLDEINQYVTNAAASVPELSSDYSNAYDNAGQSVYEQEQSGERNRASSALDKLFTPGYEYTKIADTVDDPYIADIEAEQEKLATDYLQNLLNREVITQSGYDAGNKNIQGQEAGVLAKLNELGGGQLAAGRGNLTDISNRAYSTAGSMKLGTPFDAASYGTQVDKAFQDWLGNLGTNIRGGVGSQPLFDTSGLSAIAGGAQGAGASQVFDPKALAGINEDDEDKKDENRTGADATSVF